jgi:hypothetical protein
MSEPIICSWRGSLASSGKWLKIGDAGDASATFDLVAQDLAEVVKLAGYGGKELEFAVRLAPEESKTGR